MKNEYHHDIVNILLHCGSEGASARHISRLIYNMHCGLFEDSVVFGTIHQQVRLYLWHQSRRMTSPFMHIGWGVYAIKPDFAIQLDFMDELYSTLEHRTSTPINNEKPEGGRAIQLTLF